ncbi:55_t:CDS:2, partial [Acaulospora colombiana]
MSSDLRRHHKEDPADSSSSVESNNAVRGQRARLDQASRRDRTGAKRNILGSTIKHLLLWNLEIFNLMVRLMKKPMYVLDLHRPLHRCNRASLSLAGFIRNEPVRTATRASSLGAHLGMEMKRSESAVRDLSAVVGASDLKSKKELESSLNELASSMKQAVPLLSKMEAAMDGTVD